MPPSYFPLRWESTGEQWWYASPIDWAAANGHYDLVRELIRLDNNLLMNLTSLRRIRRLETVWDDEAQFIDVAKCRSHIARNLFLECEIKKGKNSLICSGYGGWLLYTAASAGDLGFVQEILERNPLLVFGEGEYGVTDIFYAASRSKNSEVFRLLFVCAFSPRHSFGRGGELDECSSDVPTVFKWEMMNRAAHAAARGGNLEILRELLRGCSDVLVYRDAQGSTLLHAASGRGQVEVVKDLMGSFDIITSKDNQGNTALHVAAYRGHLGVVEALVHSSPSLTSSPNNAGDTFLHLAVAAFRAPSFHRLDRQIELMKQLVCGKITSLQEVINIRNNNGRTALHMAVIGNIHSNLVELLMSAPSIDLNICDNDNMTPLDLLNQHPQSASSEILIKRMTSAGGISNLQQDHMASSTIVSSRIKMQGPRSSPGTSFGISDAEIFFYSGVQNVSEASFGPSSCSSSSRSNFSHFENVNESGDKSSSSIYSASRHLKLLLGWPRRKEKKLDCNVADSCQVLVDNDQLEACKKLSDPEYNSTGLRQRFSKPPLLPNNKRTLSVRSSLPNPSTKKKFAAGLMNGVIQAMPNLAFSSPSPAGPCSRSHLSSSSKLMDKKKGIRKKGIPSDSEIGGPSYTKPYLDSGTPEMLLKSSSGSGGGLKNQYFCFGAPVLCVDDSITGQRQANRVYKHSVLPMA